MERYPDNFEEIGTVRALRLALTQIGNQQMTIAELRRKLFDLDDQNKVLTITDLQDITKE